MNNTFLIARFALFIVRNFFCLNQIKLYGFIYALQMINFMGTILNTIKYDTQNINGYNNLFISRCEVVRLFLFLLFSFLVQKL